ncbi:lipid droplet-associated perilipin protein [Lentinus tigrinus ALCF2SS1-7]|uniref:Lipid droplet-associated perilipin protein n=1 Tax=Lentinus tigrinus ALCF2SS1-6 TaxID=1328759 RepID=A0A5C2SAQ8_9APHY|nr:lipid droplet-associated perilipin protein [Lentinus tigrinus ALCF2SS1-6]RPD69504.1 lipid droplet-associated perilipin protein [Lentinus tigrinus ALCF2SS1-7]
MATQTQEAPAAATPELTIFQRVGSIPLVADSLNTINTTLLNNAYTRSPYTTATELSKKALSYTEPLQKTLAPILTKADDLANKGFDAVESRIPYPFHATTEDVIKDLKGRSDAAKDVATKTIDEKVRTPALNIAQGIDQKFTPIVDYFAGAVKQFQPTGTADKPAETPEAKYQYQRAYYLSKELRDQLYTYSTEQINQIKTQNVVLQRASATAHSLTDLASTSYGAAQTRVHALSDNMLSELQKVQASTAALPGTLQSAFQDVSTNLSATINELSGILKSPDPLPEKAHKVRETVQERVQPILDTATARVQEILGALKARVSEERQPVTVQSATTTSGATTVNVNGVNGHA